MWAGLEAVLASSKSLRVLREQLAEALDHRDGLFSERLPVGLRGGVFGCPCCGFTLEVVADGARERPIVIGAIEGVLEGVRVDEHLGVVQERLCEQGTGLGLGEGVLAVSSVRRVLFLRAQAEGRVVQEVVELEDGIVRVLRRLDLFGQQCLPVDVRRLEEPIEADPVVLRRVVADELCG